MKEQDKFPVKPLIGCLVYGITAEYFDFGSKDWFNLVRPDIWLAHPLYGYFLSSLGRWGSQKLQISKDKKDLASKVVGGTGISIKEIADIIRYSDINALSICDMLGGAFGVLLENYKSLKNRTSKISKAI